MIDTIYIIFCVLLFFSVLWGLFSPLPETREKVDDEVAAKETK